MSGGSASSHVTTLAGGITIDQNDDDLRRLRSLAIVVILGLIAASVIVDLAGRIVVSLDFRVDSVIFGSLIGALLALLLGEMANKVIPPRNKEKNDG